MNERGIWNTGNIDRGLWTRIYFRDPNGQLLELACFKFVPPEGFTMAMCSLPLTAFVLLLVTINIEDRHLADAINELVEGRTTSLTHLE